MKAKKEPRLNLKHCPFTRQVFRHPVLASDGYYYELFSLWSELLSKGQIISPLTKEKICYIHYDLQLKEEIGSIPQDNQYPNYKKEELLVKLTSRLASPYLSWRQTVYKSSVTALLLGLVVLFIVAAKKNELSPEFFLAALLIAGMADFSVRMRSAHRYGLFGGSVRIINYVIDEGPRVLQMLDGVEPEHL